MKKHLLILSALACFCIQSANAQYWTLRVAGGYAWPGFIKTESFKTPAIDPANPAVDALVDMANRVDFPDTIKSVKPIKGSYGQGMNFTLGVGYMINPYFGVDLGVSFLKSKTFTSHEQHELVLNDGAFLSHTGYALTADLTTSAFGLSLMPSVVVTGAKPGFKVYPYARLGITMPVFGGNVTDVKIHIPEQVFTEHPSFTTLLAKTPYFLGRETVVKVKTEGTVSLGVNAAIGIAYRPLPYLSVFAEVNGQYLTTRAKSAKVTQWDADGVSKLSDRGIYRTEFTFVDELSNTSNNKEYNSSYDKTKPKEDVRPFGPFSNLGLNVGLTFMFSKETLKKQEKKERAK